MSHRSHALNDLKASIHNTRVGVFWSHPHTEYVRLCNRCKTYKFPDEFYFSKAKQRYETAVCKPCTIKGVRLNQKRITFGSDAYFRKKVADIKHRAKDRGKECTLTWEQLKAKASKKCAYCDKEITDDFTVDRVDNSIGYVVSNIAPCCFQCNTRKSFSNLEGLKQRVAGYEDKIRSCKRLIRVLEKRVKRGRGD